MLQDRTKYLTINWLDGMSINKNHFIALENYFNEAINDAIGQRTGKNNYGLLPTNKEVQAISIEADSRNVLHIRIKELRAVTLCGARIEITADTIPVLELTGKIADFVPTDNEETNYSVVLTVDPFAREPFGNADPEETPPRKPFVLPSYHINLVPTKELDNSEIGLFHLTLGKLTIKNGECTVDQSYIPPCTNVESHPLLMEFFYRVEKLMMELEHYVLIIVQKVRGKNQKNTLALTVNYLAENILNYLNYNLPSITMQLKYQAPVNLIEKIAVLGRVTHNSIDTWQGNGKEELINYLVEWCELNQGLFDKTLAELSGLVYKHHDIATSLKKTDNFLRMLVPLLKSLSELDYIGKKVDTTLFVTEENDATDDRMEQSVDKKNWFKKF